MPRLIDTDALKFPNIAIFDMKLHGVTVPMVRLIDLRMLMPTVDAAPVKHGKWEYVPTDGKFRAILICSKCKRSVGEYDRYKFCPHCGAKMDLEED